MQVSPLNGLPPVPANSPTQRQQVELSQASNTASEGTASVLPSTASAVRATGQSAAKNAADDGSQQKKSSQQDLENSLKQLNDVAKLYSSKLEFSVDKDTNISVVKVVDQETNKVIRQIPSEDAIRIAKAIGDFKGLLLKDKA